MDVFTKSLLLLFVLLNPFIMSIYLIELVNALKFGIFSRQIIWAGIISFSIFIFFAYAGDKIFTDVLQIRFMSFLIFGGITFLIVGTRLLLSMGSPIEVLHPNSENLSAAIAMPFMVGPGTISASVLAGTRLDFPLAVLAIFLAMVSAIFAILVFKWVHDFVRKRNEKWVERYTTIAGRATALFTGAFAIEMILKGIELWLKQLEG